MKNHHDGLVTIKVVKDGSRWTFASPNIEAESEDEARRIFATWIASDRRDADIVAACEAAARAEGAST